MRPEPLLYSVNDLAHVLRISRGLVYRLVRRGDLIPVQVGDRLRFRIDDVEAYLDRRRVGSARKLTDLRGGDADNNSPAAA